MKKGVRAVPRQWPEFDKNGEGRDQSYSQKSVDVVTYEGNITHDDQQIRSVREGPQHRPNCRVRASTGSSPTARARSRFQDRLGECQARRTVGGGTGDPRRINNNSEERPLSFEREPLGWWAPRAQMSGRPLVFFSFSQRGEQNERNCGRATSSSEWRSRAHNDAVAARRA